MDGKPIPSALSDLPRLGRPSRTFRQQLSAVEPPATCISASTLWLRCGFLGFIAGLIEGMLRLGWRLSGWHVHNPDLWVNWHTPWMAAVSLGALGFGAGIVLSLLHVFAPRKTLRLAPIVLVGLGVWSVVGIVPGLEWWSVGMVAFGAAFGIGKTLDVTRRPRRGIVPASFGIWGVLVVTTGVYPTISPRLSLALDPKPSPGAPNVLLVVLDTVRADHLSQHGYGRNTSPNLAKWAAQGVRFDQARSPTPYTLGTHASLFTGRWMSETSARAGAPLDGTHRTLAEHLSDLGYATGGFVGNIFYGSQHYGLNRGFAKYHDSPGNFTRSVGLREILRSSTLGASLVHWFERKTKTVVRYQRLRLDGEEVNREALDWIDDASSHGRPFFVFANYFDAHSPYSQAAHAAHPFARITPERLEERLKELQRLEDHWESHPGSIDPDHLNRLRAEVNAQLTDCYDDGIAWADRKFAELIDGLRSRGLLDNTLVIVTADHGEMLGEHGEIGHGVSVYRPVVHVPLMIRGADGMSIPAGKVVDQPVSVRDIPATVLTLLDDPGAKTFPGQSLSRHWTGPEPPEPTPVLTEMEHLSWRKRSPRAPASLGPLQLLTHDGYTYHRQDRPGQAPTESLFDLRTDPGETRNLADDSAHEPQLHLLRELLKRTQSGP